MNLNMYLLQIKSSPSHGNLVPSKLCDAIKHYHNIMSNLMQAHEKWDLARQLIIDHDLGGNNKYPLIYGHLEQRCTTRINILLMY